MRWKLKWEKCPHYFGQCNSREIVTQPWELNNSRGINIYSGSLGENDIIERLGLLKHTFVHILVGKWEEEKSSSYLSNNSIGCFSLKENHPYVFNSESMDRKTFQITWETKENFSVSGHCVRLPCLVFVPKFCDFMNNSEQWFLPSFSIVAFGKFPLHFCYKDTAELLRIGIMFIMYFSIGKSIMKRATRYSLQSPQLWYLEQFEPQGKLVSW